MIEYLKKSYREGRLEQGEGCNCKSSRYLFSKREDVAYFVLHENLV